MFGVLLELRILLPTCSFATKYFFRPTRWQNLLVTQLKQFLDVKLRWF